MGEAEDATKPAKVPKQKRCRYGADCTKKGCRFFHPASPDVPPQSGPEAPQQQQQPKPASKAPKQAEKKPKTAKKAKEKFTKAKTTNKEEEPQDDSTPTSTPARTYDRTATIKKKCRWGAGCRNKRCKFLHPGQTYEPIPKNDGGDGDQNKDSCKPSDASVEDKSRILPPEKGGGQRNEPMASPRSPDKGTTAARGKGNRPGNHSTVKAFSPVESEGVPPEGFTQTSSGAAHRMSTNGAAPHRQPQEQQSPPRQRGPGAGTKTASTSPFRPYVSPSRNAAAAAAHQQREDQTIRQMMNGSSNGYSPGAVSAPSPQPQKSGEANANEGGGGNGGDNDWLYEVLGFKTCEEVESSIDNKKAPPPPPHQQQHHHHQQQQPQPQQTQEKKHYVRHNPRESQPDRQAGRKQREEDESTLTNEAGNANQNVANNHQQGQQQPQFHHHYQHHGPIQGHYSNSNYQAQYGHQQYTPYGNVQYHGYSNSNYQAQYDISMNRQVHANDYQSQQPVANNGRPLHNNMMDVRQAHAAAFVPLNAVPPSAQQQQGGRSFGTNPSPAHHHCHYQQGGRSAGMNPPLPHQQKPTAGNNLAAGYGHSPSHIKTCDEVEREATAQLVTSDSNGQAADREASDAQLQQSSRALQNHGPPINLTPASSARSNVNQQTRKQSDTKLAPAVGPPINNKAAHSKKLANPNTNKSKSQLKSSAQSRGVPINLKAAGSAKANANQQRQNQTNGNSVSAQGPPINLKPAPTKKPARSSAGQQRQNRPKAATQNRSAPINLKPAASPKPQSFGRAVAATATAAASAPARNQAPRGRQAPVQNATASAAPTGPTKLLLPDAEITQSRIVARQLHTEAEDSDCNTERLTTLLQICRSKQEMIRTALMRGDDTNVDEANLVALLEINDKLGMAIAIAEKSLRTPQPAFHAASSSSSEGRSSMAASNPRNQTSRVKEGSKNGHKEATFQTVKGKASKKGAKSGKTDAKADTKKTKKKQTSEIAQQPKSQPVTKSKSAHPVQQSKLPASAKTSTKVSNTSEEQKTPRVKFATEPDVVEEPQSEPAEEEDEVDLVQQEKERMARLMEEARKQSAAAREKKKNKKSQKFDRWVKQNEEEKAARAKSWAGRIGTESHHTGLIERLLVAEFVRQNSSKATGLTPERVLEDIHSSEVLAKECSEAYHVLFVGAKYRIIVAGSDNKDLNGRQGTIRYWDKDKAKFCVGLDTKKCTDNEVQYIPPELLDLFVPNNRSSKADKKNAPQASYEVESIGLLEYDGITLDLKFALLKTHVVMLDSAPSMELGIKAFCQKRDNEERRRRQEEEAERQRDEEDRKRRAEMKRRENEEWQKRKEQIKQEKAKVEEMKRAWARERAARQAAQNERSFGGGFDGGFGSFFDDDDDDDDYENDEDWRELKRRMGARFGFSHSGGPGGGAGFFFTFNIGGIPFRFGLGSDDEDDDDSYFDGFDWDERRAEEREEENRRQAELLGVEPDADARTIKLAYRKMALQYHPDKWKADSDHGMSREDAECRFKEMQNAYDHLMANFDD